MASKSRPRPKRQPNQLADLGLFNIPDLDLADNMDDDSEVDESALESELEALLSGKAPARPTRPKPKVAPVVDIEKLAEACLKDDDEDEEDDGNLSGDEDLLNELQSIAADSLAENCEPPEKDEPPEIPKRKSSNLQTESSQSADSLICSLEERLTMYNEAVKVAKLAGDSSKIRRYGRGVKTLEGLIKSVKSGGIINEEDIPPIVKIPKINADSSANLNKPVSALNNSVSNGTPVAGLCNSALLDAIQNQTETGNNKSEELCLPSSEAPLTKSQLIMRRDQYKVAAVMAKRSGNRDLALSYLRTVKTFDTVIEAIDNNLPVDLSNVPPPPPEVSVVTPKASTQRKVEHDEVQASSDIEKAALAAANDAEEPEIFAAPPPPSSVLEALEQRLNKYTATKEAAEAEGNSGKIRRLQRIIKQYETAIKDYKAGKNIVFEELPTPPGFAPIPVPSAKLPSVTKPVGENAGQSPKELNKMSKTHNRSPNQPPNNPAVKKPKVQRTNTSTVGEKQLEFLLERQKLFRQAALTAKQNDDIQQAKEYLRMAKGFDSMIEATRCGLPIDATTIPTPPQLESSDFVIVDVSECTPNENCTQEELHENLEKDLRHQIEICTRNKEHFLRLGDVSSASKFEKLCLESKKDLTVIHHLKKKGEPVPRLFHYETRLFSMVLCHADLGDNDLEVTVERGINLPGKPDDLDSYIRLEFPFPPETPQRAKTHTIRDTNNPIFQEEFKFEFNRKSRSQIRQFKRSVLKLEVWCKGGFLRSDSLLGTCNVKLADLESKCTIHDSFNLMDGRKSVGGKLEVKLRLRDPLLVKQVEEVREKWLVIGS